MNLVATCAFRFKKRLTLRKKRVLNKKGDTQESKQPKGFRYRNLLNIRYFHETSF